MAEALLADVHEHPKRERIELGRAINAARGGFGQPHLHAGIGLRKLAANIYECRAGLALRFVFEHRPHLLRFLFMGDHDAVRRYLKGR